MSTASVDERRRRHEKEEYEASDAEGDPEGAEGFRLPSSSPVDTVARAVWFDELSAVHGEGGDADGQDVRHDGAEADEGDEVVAVEKGADGKVAVGGGGVVERQDAAWGVPTREDVKGLDGADVAFERAPDEFDHSREGGEEPGEFVRDDVGRGEHDNGDEA